MPQLLDALLYKVSPAWSDRLTIYRQVVGAVIPPGTIGQPAPDNFPTEESGHAGIDLHEDEQVERLRGWAAYADLYRALRLDPEVNVAGDEGAITNRWYETPEAEVYASMICDHRPTEIVEIGAGYSTLVARRALTWAGIDAPLTAIDPEPRRSVEAAATTVIRRRVEDADRQGPPFAGLGERPLLFIDSSHVARAGGDVALLFNTVVPGLPDGALVHVDDIYLPWEYPLSYQKRLYSEQYVLQALLAFSERFRTAWAGHLMSRRHTALMREVISPGVAANHAHLGSSYWFTVGEGTRPAAAPPPG